MKIESVPKQDGDTIVEGILVCANELCQSEFPIIDGIPIIVADLRAYITQHLFPILNRDDLSGSIESLLGDCAGPSSALDLQRQALSAYGYDHYGDLDPEDENGGGCVPGGIVRLAQKGFEAIEGPVSGPMIDVGCSVGRSSFEIAGRFGKPVCGIDMNFNMLRMASRILRQGRAVYPKRRVGVVYDRRDFPIHFENADNVDFWACDAMALPFPSASVSLATSFNVLDCLHSPHDHLTSLARVLKPGAPAILATPYDWNATSTPVEAWVGGHSQRSPNRGSSEAMLKSIFTGGKNTPVAVGLKLVREWDSLPWSVRLHDRGATSYQAHMVLVEATASKPV